METYFTLDEQGEAVAQTDLETWQAWLETADLGVARTLVTPQVAVLTTFVPVAEAVPEGSVPQPFVTRVFGGILDGDERRSSSRADALATHDNVVEWCRAGEALEGETGPAADE